LSSQHKEWSRKFMRSALHRDIAFLHGFEKSGLRFWRRAVDFVRQNNVREYRPTDKFQGASTGRAIFLDDLGAGNIGRHQIRRELNALERKIQNVGNGANQQSLGQSGNTGDDRMSSYEKREEDLFDNFILTDYRFSNFLKQLFARSNQLVQYDIVA